MTNRLPLALSAIVLSFGLAGIPAAQAATDSMHKMAPMKHHKAHNHSMMKGDTMKKDQAPAQ